jgi:penicillin-binding protein 2
MRNEKGKYQKFTRRALVLGAVKAGLMSCLIGRFYYLQILEADKYETLSDKNRLRIFLTPPKRGEILDSNGAVLARNTKTYSLFIKREHRNQIKDLVEKINNIIVGQKINFAIISNKASSMSNIQSIKLLENLLLQNAILLDSHPDLREIEIKEDFIREYPLKGQAFHITGYLGSTNKTDVHDSKIPKYYDFLVGKDGIEKEFEDKLKGQSGMQKIEVDAKGSFIKKLDFSPATLGESVKLSLNKDVQNTIWHHMKDYTGAIAVMDLRINKVIGLVSSPTLDPNIFIGGLSHDDWSAIKAQKSNPFINKCISAKYPPGSIFKFVMYLAILKQRLDPEHSIFCKGHYQIGNRVYGCWKKSGHGHVNLDQALAQSCNVYFFEQSLKIGIKKIHEMANLLGLSQKTNIELPFEIKGLMPNKAWKKSRFKTNWYPGDTLNTCIGQGYVEATPIQLLQMVSKIATSKNLHASIIDSEYDDIDQKLDINPADLERLRSAMLKVFYDPRGTGYNSRIEDPEFQIAGKSSTSQIIGTQHNSKNALYKDNSLFTGFAPFGNPRFAIATIIENGGWGSETAVPMSKNILLDIRNHV